MKERSRVTVWSSRVDTTKQVLPPAPMGQGMGFAGARGGNPRLGGGQ